MMFLSHSFLVTFWGVDIYAMANLLNEFNMIEVFNSYTEYFGSLKWPNMIQLSHKLKKIQQVKSAINWGKITTVQYYIRIDYD